MLWLVALGLWAAAAVAHFLPDTPLGRACRAWAVERPSAWLARRSAAEVAASALFVVALAALAPALPLESALLAAGDLAVYAELSLLVAVAAIRSGAHRRRVSVALRSRLAAAASPARLGLGRARERRRRAPRRAPPVDDGDGPDGAFPSPACA